MRTWKKEDQVHRNRVRILLLASMLTAALASTACCGWNACMDACESHTVKEDPCKPVTLPCLKP